MNLKLVSGLVLCGVFAVACGDSGSDTPAGGGTSDGGNSGDGGNGGSTGVLSGGNPNVGGDPGTGGSGAEAPDCYDGDSALVFQDGAFSGVTIDQGVCDATQIADALTECFAPGTMETCQAYLDANPECGDCIFGGADAGGPMSVFLGSDNFTYLTLYACQAFASDLPQCAVPYQALLFCANTACESCDAEAGTEKSDCINFALNDPEVCGALPLDAACEPLFQAEELPAECVGNPAGTTFETVYPVIADYYCGTAG